MHKEGMSLCGIAKNIGLAYTTIYYEFLRGTPPHKNNRDRITGYTAKSTDKIDRDDREG